MKLKDGFLTHDLNGQQVLVSVGGSDFAGLVRSNETAAFIVDCLKQDTTPEAIIEALAAEYDAPRERLIDGVALVLATLSEIGALEE